MAKKVKEAKKSKQEKLLEKEERKRERRIMKEKVKQYDGGFMSRCIALLLGFILGIAGTIGGVAGAGYYIISKNSIKDVAAIAGSDKFDLDKYLAAEYSEKTLLQFFKDIGEITDKLKGAEACIATLAEISPYISDLADRLAEQLSDFGLDVDTEKLKATPFKELSTFLQETLQETKLGKLIGAEPDGTLMGLLCYGEEGVDYTLDADGNITWIGDSHELSVKDFMDNGATSDIFNRLSLKAVMETNGSVKTDDPITRVLVYGTKDIDYIASTGSDGVETIAMLPLAYSYDISTGILTDDHGKTVTNYFAYDSGSKAIAVFDKETPEEGDEPDSYLYMDETDGIWYAYASKEDLGLAVSGSSEAITKRILHRATTLGDVLKGDFMGMVEDVELASLLNVSAKSEGTMLALAYGNEGEDYKIEGNDIVMLNGAKPRTIKDLRDGKVKFEDLELCGVLKIKPHDGSNDTMQSLAFGEEGKHYTYDEATEKITWLPKRYIEKLENADWALFDADGNKIDGAEKAANVWSFTENGVTYKTVAPAGAKGLHTYYIYVDGDAEQTPVCYKARTISDLTNLQTSDLIGGATLENMLKVTANTDGVLRSLAYGKEGVTYKIENGEVVMLPIKYSFDGTKWTDENGTEIASPSPINLGGHVYEFLRTKDGHTQYVYATATDGAAGSYAVCDALGAELTHKKRSIDALQSDNATEVFNEIELRAVIPEKIDDSLNLYLLYGKEGTNYEIVLDSEGNKTIKLLTAPKTIASLRQTGDDSIFVKLRKELTIGELLGDKANGNKVLENLKDATLDNLGEEINKLTIGNIVDNAESNKILKHLSSATLTNLNDKINELTITEIFEDEIYDNSSNPKTIRGTWKYLLKDKDSGEIREDYKLNDMNKLTENMTANIKTTVLEDLDNDLQLDLSDSFMEMGLNSNIVDTMISDGNITMYEGREKPAKIKQLTIVEVSHYIPKLIDYYQGLIPSPSSA